MRETDASHAGRCGDLSSLVQDICPDTIAPLRLERLAKYNQDDLPLVEGPTRIGPCVGGVGKLLAIGPY